MANDITLKDLEDALEDAFDQWPAYPTWHSTGMVNSKGEPLYLVNIGSKTHPAYIGGTKVQLEERIREFYKQILDLL